MAYLTLLYDKKDRVVFLTLNRPQQGNLLNLELANELGDACRQINEDDGVWAVVLAGAGDAFCRGSDLSQLYAAAGEAISAARLRELNPAAVASQAMAAVNCPVIAAISGAALGAGLELALCCDIRIAAENAQFGFPEASQGLIPGGGGTQRLPRIVGRGKAAEMLLAAESIDAAEAYRVGLVSEVVTAGELLGRAEELAWKIAALGPIALRYTKEALNKGLELPLEQGLRLEADLSLLLHTTRDRAEGIAAFLQKRRAQFEGA